MPLTAASCSASDLTAASSMQRISLADLLLVAVAELRELIEHARIAVPPGICVFIVLAGLGLGWAWIELRTQSPYAPASRRGPPPQQRALLRG